MADFEEATDIDDADKSPESYEPMTVNVDILDEQARQLLTIFAMACVKTGLNPEYADARIISNIINELSGTYVIIDDGEMNGSEVRKNKKYFKSDNGHSANIPDPVKNHLISKRHFTLRPIAGIRDENQLINLFETLVEAGIFARVYICEQDEERFKDNEAVLLKSTIDLWANSKFQYSRIK